MRINLIEYLKYIPQLEAYLKGKESRSLHTVLGEFANFLMVPVISVYFMYGTKYGFTPEIDQAMDNLVKFYGYEL